MELSLSTWYRTFLAVSTRNLTRSHLLVVDYASSLRVALDETKSYASDYYNTKVRQVEALLIWSMNPVNGKSFIFYFTFILGVNRFPLGTFISLSRKVESRTFLAYLKAWTGSRCIKTNKQTNSVYVIRILISKREPVHGA